MLRDDSSWRFKMPDPANVGDIYNLGLLPYHKRCPMNVHEYQAKAILRDYGVPVPRGHAAFAPEEAVAVAKELGGPITVVKAQIHAGGRGKGRFKERGAGDKGGVRIAKSMDDVRLFADQMLTNTLLTVQTGPVGRVVKRLLVEEGAAIARELYLSFLIDRITSRVAIIASTEGGMNIEEVAHKTPEKIFTIHIDPATGYSQFHGRQVAFALGLKDGQIRQCVNLIGNLYRAFTEKDMSLPNPLIVTEKGEPRRRGREDRAGGQDGGTEGRAQATLALNEVSDWVLSQARDDVVAVRSPEVFK